MRFGTLAVTEWSRTGVGSRVTVRMIPCGQGPRRRMVEVMSGVVKPRVVHTVLSSVLRCYHAVSCFSHILWQLMELSVQTLEICRRSCGYERDALPSGSSDIGNLGQEL